MTVNGDVYFDVARIFSKWMRHQIIKLSHNTFISKRDVWQERKGIITWSIFTRRFFNQTLSIYVQLLSTAHT